MIFRASVTLLLTLSGCAARSEFKLARGSSHKPTTTSRTFSGDFWWGVSASSYQFEDPGPDEENLGFKTDWDLAYESGFIKYPRANGTWSYSRYDRDIAAMKSLGLTHFRFSIEWARSEEHTSELQSPYVISYAVFCLKKK